MVFLTFVVAVAALAWAIRNHFALGNVEDNYALLQREIARLTRELARDAVQKTEPPVATPDPAPLPERPAQPREPATALPPKVLQPLRQAASAPKPSIPAFDWEGLVGVQLFSWIAGIALVLAGIFFLKYSIDHGWLGPPMRMIIGLLTGITLLIVCEWKVARRYSTTANAMDGAGIAILFATFFASNAMWNLLGTFTAFAMMALVTAVAVLLSLRHNSVFVALLGLVGGFATPALLSTGENRPIGLFTYLLFLNAGLSWVAYRKRWPYLTVASAIFTTLYQWGWTFRFLEPGTIPLALTIFTVFPVLSRVAMSFGEGTEDQHSSLFRQTSAITAVLPVLFAVYLGVIPAYGSRYWLLFGFLLLLDAGLTAVAAMRGPEVLHLAGGLGTIVTLWAWLQRSYTSEVWPVLLGVVALFVLYYLVSGYLIRFNDVGARGALVAPLLLVAFPVLAGIEPAAETPGALFITLFLLIAAVGLYAFLKRDAAVHALGGVFAVATQLVWSAKYLTVGHLNEALAIYSVFGVLYLLISVAASESIGRWRYLSLSGHAFLLLVILRDTFSAPARPFLIVLGLLDVVVAVASLYRRRGDLVIGALGASQMIILLWHLISSGDASTAVASALAVAGLGALQFLLMREDRSFALASVVASGLGILTVWVAAAATVPPAITLMAASIVIFLSLILLVATFTGWKILAPVSVFPAACVVFTWSAEHFQVMQWRHELLFALAIHMAFLAYPLMLGSRLGKSLEPHLAAVLSSAMFFIHARHSLLEGGYDSVIGILPVAQAGLMGLLLWKLLRLEPPTERAMGRLAMVAAAVLAFVTVAIPLQLEKEWITIGWVLLAASLAWLRRRIPHQGIVIWTAGLVVLVFARLALNPAVLSYHPRGEIPVFNWYLYTYLVSAGAFFVVARLLRGIDRFVDDFIGLTPVATALGTVLLFLLLNIEIADYYAVGSSVTFNFTAGLGQDLTYTIGWAVFAFAMLIAGIVLATKPGRVAAILLLSVTIAKCFLHDLWRLGGLYRVGSFVGLAVCLTMVAVLLQKFVLQAQEAGVELPSPNRSE